jgi:phosphoribosylformimino-5-aminoimidazole carboxamide ribotide isomerase
MQVIPAVDVLGDDAVRLLRGEFDEVLFRAPLDDFVAQVASTGPELIHLVDLQGARDGAFRLSVLRRCVAAAGGIAVQVSGGVRSIEAARAALDGGAARVVVGTAAWAHPEALARFGAALGTDLVVAFDVRSGRVESHGWRGSTALTVTEAMERCVRADVPRLHVTAIERDGTMQGPDLELYRRACDSGIPIVAAGGVRDDDDVAALSAVGCEAAVMGVGYLGRLPRPPASSPEDVTSS